MQNISNQPIEPTSHYNHFKRLYDFLPKKGLIALGVAWGLFVTPLTTAITMQELQRGKTKQALEQEFSREISVIPNWIEKLITATSKPGRELAYYLHDKGYKLKF